MAEQLYHAFSIIPNLRYRVVAILEQRVGGQWIQMAQTKLATFNPRRSWDLRMPQQPPPPPPASEDQVVPESPPEEPAQPSSDAPGPIKVQRTTHRTPEQRRTPPPDPVSHLWPGKDQSTMTKLYHHDQIVPPWGELATDIWFACTICAESAAHSGVVCGQCGGRPACCRCMMFLELDRHTMGRCPLCRYEGPQ
jgi:hypothetical protein